MTRWLWIWFFLIISFPLSPPATWIRTSGAKPRVAASKWGGPLARVIDHLDFVEGHRTSAAELRGQVVVAEIWAFECINCRRTLPAMKSLARRYRDTDVRLLSIHTPELPAERDPANVTKAVAESAIDWPVALDPEYVAWDALDNRYWPCLYLLDRDGKVAWRHIGELHEGTDTWNDMIGRIDSLRAVHG